MMPQVRLYQGLPGAALAPPGCPVPSLRRSRVPAGLPGPAAQRARAALGAANRPAGAPGHPRVCHPRRPEQARGAACTGLPARSGRAFGSVLLGSSRGRATPPASGAAAPPCLAMLRMCRRLPDTSPVYPPAASTRRLGMASPSCACHRRPTTPMLAPGCGGRRVWWRPAPAQAARLGAARRCERHLPPVTAAVPAGTTAEHCRTLCPHPHAYMHRPPRAAGPWASTRAPWTPRAPPSWLPP